MTAETRTANYSISIDARPEQVFAYLVDPALMIRWMGDYAVLDPTPGGTFLVDINGVPVRGNYVEVEPPNRVVVTWGMAGSDTLPAGSTRVEFSLTAVGDTTLVAITHSGIPVAHADQHLVGWTHFGERLALAASGRDPGPDTWAEHQPS